MNRPLDEDDLPVRGYGQRSDPDADREISLGTPTILGIFFALALVCACFFAFGYSMGRRSAQAAVPAGNAGDTMSVSNSIKPTAGSLAGQRATPAPPPAAESPAASEPAQTETVSIAPPTTAKNAVNPADGMIVGDKRPPPAPQPATSNPQPAGSFVVQIAAVSTQDLADLEVNALTKKGYKVDIRHEPQDKLLHVQIGPFTDRKEAEAMRQRVLADGFNAIVK